MKVNSISLNNSYPTTSFNKINFRGDSNRALTATNPDVPQFRQALKTNKTSNFLVNFKSLFNRKNSDNVYNQQGLENYITQRVFLI